MNNIENMILSLKEKLEEFGAYDIVVLNLEKKSTLFKRAIIVTGTSSKHVMSISDRISDFLKEKHAIFTKAEGYDECEWILMDAGDIIINVFKQETRDKYKLERLWG